MARKQTAPSPLPQWDLSALYPGPDSPEIERDLRKASRLCAKFQAAYEGKVSQLGGDALAAAIREYEAIADLLGRLSSYAQLLHAGNIQDPAIGRFYQNIQERVNALSSGALFFGLAVNKLGDKALKDKLRSAQLARYAPWLRDVRAMRKYQLSDEMEKLLHEKRVAGSAAWARLFDETLAGLRFPFKGRPRTCEEMLDRLSSPDAREREGAGKALGKTFAEHAQQFALIANTLAKDKEIEDRWRGFPAPISARNVANQVEDAVVEALISAVKGNYHRLSHRYYRLKAGWLGKKRLAYWDRNAPLPRAGNKRWSWQEAQEIVLFSYQEFSPELAAIGRRFFDERWIDVPARPGKAPGAFSHPAAPSAHPYILLNFLGKTRDVMTLAHELGHGVHQVLSAGQGALMADAPLTLAETASVFGEQLAFRELLRREKHPHRRCFMIASKVEDMLSTVVRQIAFCEFERRLHGERRSGELTAERIGELWMETQRESLGPAFSFSREYRWYWTYIGHFIHSPFYVYAYAFGDCLVNALYAVYQREAAAGRARDFENKYIAMLRAGGTLHHKELLAPFGLDASQPGFWRQGLDIISGFIDELEGLT